MNDFHTELEKMELPELIALVEKATALLHRRKELKHSRVRESIEKQAIASGLTAEERKMLFGA